MPTLTSLEDVAQRLNATNTAVNARSKSVKVNSTTTRTSSAGVVDLTGVVITGVKDSAGTTITPDAAGVVTLPAASSTLAPSTTSVTDPS